MEASICDQEKLCKANELLPDRSLALLLAMLSNKDLSRPFHKAKARRAVKATRKKASIEQILLVPHTELARQFEGWLDRLRVAPLEEASVQSDHANAGAGGKILDEDAQSSIEVKAPALNPPFTPFPALRHTQVLYRGTRNQLDISTRFLITTPKYLVEILDSIATDDLHTIGLDEADEMLKLPNRFHTHKDEVKWLRHPPLLLTIMDELLAPPTSHSGNSPNRRSKRIVAVSASANSVFRDYLVRRSGWLKGESTDRVPVEGTEDRRFDWYDYSSEPLTADGTQNSSALSELQRVGRTLMPRAEVKHVLAKVDRLGDIVDGDAASPEETLETAMDPNRFLVATATLFALKQVERGLLLIPSTQSLQGTLEFLQSLAVPAAPLSEAFSTSNSSDEPILYVASVDSIRGVDIPRLEWIFITPETKAQSDSKDYMHIAGRVGRLLDSEGSRGSGHIVNFIDANDERQYRKLTNVWQLLGIEGEALQPEEVV